MNFKENRVNEQDNFIRNLPKLTFGTSGLGNLFVELNDESKCAIIEECIRLSDTPVVFDSAGKYGAGLALEVLGKYLKQLNISSDDVIISNKLAWVRTELKTAEPTFEPGVWKGLKYDAVQKISYEGIIECFEQGNELLGSYIPQMVSVHDPDEYIATAKNDEDREGLYGDVMEAYRALFDLKKQGKVKAVGLGAKDWRMVKRIATDVQLDWVMIANSMTIKSHPQELLAFMQKLADDGVAIINAAVFHSGFLVGSDYFDYKLVEKGTKEGAELYKWRAEFFSVCSKYNVKPAAACVQFGLYAPGVTSIALSTTEPKRVKENVDLVNAKIPSAFWNEMLEKGLIQVNFFKNTILSEAK